MSDATNLEDILDILFSIRNTLTQSGEGTLMGLLLENERRGENIECRMLPKLLEALYALEQAVLASTIIIAKPTNPTKELQKAYATVENFLNERNKRAQ